ncbi:MAG: butyrate kinase [Marinifilaceae bacterium]|jgi:butyrate kinase|nr:butyrate kinase [Marinifilaceae bacterium]
MERNLSLIVNPRNIYTELAIYDMHNIVFHKKINHSEKDLKKYKCYCSQTDFRKDLILAELDKNEINTGQIKFVFGRGGLIRPVESGVYEVSNKMVDDLVNCRLGKDVVNLGGVLAFHLAKSFDNCQAYIADPVVVDEMHEIAKITGHPDIRRKSVFHALNQKVVGRKYADSIRKNYDDLNLIVAHIGGGTSVGAHKKGKVVDVNQAFDGEGPFSAIRAGSLPIGELIRACYSGEYTMDEMLQKQSAQGGLYAYFNTYSAMEVCQLRDEGNPKAELILNAMIYQIAKSIASMSVVFDGQKIDGIIITGAIAKDEKISSKIKSLVGHISEVFIYPGSDILAGLNYYANLINRGEIKVKQYI